MSRSRFALPAVLVALFAGVAGADQKKRWELDFKHERPEHYTYTSPMGATSNYWYFVYTVTNNTPQAVPLIVDVALHVDKRNYQESGFYPVEEMAIIAHADRMEGYNAGIQREMIEDFKKRRKYLNDADLRKISMLQPGESVHCLAMFKDMEYRYNDVEVLVSGLVDPVSYKWEREAGSFTSSSAIHLRYENKVFRLTYGREGDQFQSFRRGLELRKHDWIVVGVNPAVTKEDVGELVHALTHDDPLVRRIARDLLQRYTLAPRSDIDLRGLDTDAKVAMLQGKKDVLIALASMQAINNAWPGVLTNVEGTLKERVPPIPDELKSIKLGDSLNSDQIKDACDKLKVVIVKAMENKCPTPGTSIAVLTRAEPTQENVIDWVCGYKDPSTGILYHGIQQWEEFIADLCSKNQQGAFNFMESVFECMNSDDPVVRDYAVSVLKDLATDDRMLFDTAAFDPKKPVEEQDAAIRDGVWRWREWYSRNRDKSYWNPVTKSFEPVGK